MYSSLDSDQIHVTVERLKQRINERFPASGLAQVCAELSELVQLSRVRAEKMARPNILLRLTLSVVVLATLAGLVYSVTALNLTFASLTAGELVQVIDAATNEVVLIGAAIFFLLSAEGRIKRMRALAALHELRSIAHVIDMHQLTKDPGQREIDVVRTPSSQPVKMTTFEMIRYLDYCTEMLSLTGKIAAIYAQTMNDPVVLSAVNEVESLATGLSRKIWQKIMILHQLNELH